MKTKDIITIVICALVIAGAAYFGFTMFAPTKPASTTGTTTPNPTESSITGEIDQDTLDKLNSLKSYGDTNLNDIGRVNPFAPIN